MDNDQFIDDPVKVYLNEVSKVPPLSPSEERRCIQLVRCGGQEAETAAKDLVEANLHVVVAIAERHQNQGVHILDLIQIGNQGLLDAVRIPSDDLPDGFAAYASPYIESAIRKHIATPSERVQQVPVHRRPR